MPIDAETDILGLIDVQPTFMPGGELPVADGDAVVPVDQSPDDAVRPRLRDAGLASAGARLLRQRRIRAGSPTTRSTCRTAGRCSGRTMRCRAVPTPRCIASSTWRASRSIIRKGFRPALDSYSAFFENDQQTATGLDGWLRQRGFRRLFLVGLATDFCVAWSAEDAARLGYDVTVIEDACRGIGIPTEAGRTTLDEARERLTAKGVRFVGSEKSDLIPTVVAGLDPARAHALSGADGRVEPLRPGCRRDANGLAPPLAGAGDCGMAALS